MKAIGVVFSWHPILNFKIFARSCVIPFLFLLSVLSQNFLHFRVFFKAWFFVNEGTGAWWSFHIVVARTSGQLSISKLFYFLSLFFVERGLFEWRGAFSERMTFGIFFCYIIASYSRGVYFLEFDVIKKTMFFWHSHRVTLFKSSVICHCVNILWLSYFALLYMFKPANFQFKGMSFDFFRIWLCFS